MLPLEGPATLKILEKMAADGDAKAKALIPRYKRALAKRDGEAPGPSIAAEADRNR